MDSIFGTTINVLGKSLDLRAKNHNRLAANLANAETPNYIPTKLSFEDELKGALSDKNVPSAPMHPMHIALKGSAQTVAQVEGTVVEVPSASIGRDGNGVELEAEMSRMVENQIMYSASVQLLAKKFETLKTAIKGA